MSLYKYTSAKIGYYNLLNSNIRFTQFDASNDPFDCKPCLDNVMSKEEFNDFVFRQTGENRIKLNYKRWLKGTSNYFMSEIRGMGVLSLSKKNNDILMWSHYADNHKGIVLEFDDSHPFFLKKSIKEHHWSHEVCYKSDRPSINIPQLNKNNETLDGFIRTVFFTKSEKWEYEEEYRVVRKLDDAETVLKKKLNGFKIYLFDFPVESLKSVSFGCLTPKRKKTSIINLIKAKSEYKNVVLKQAITDPKLYELKIVEG